MAGAADANDPTQHSRAQTIERLFIENRQQKELLDLIFCLDSPGLAVVAGPDLEIKMVNPAFRRILLYPETDLLDRGLDEVWPHNEGSESGHTGLKEIIHSGQAAIDQRFEWEANGAKRHFNYQISPIHWQEQVGALLAVWETSEVEEARRQVDQARAEAERRALEIEAIIDSMDEAIMVYDRDMTMRRANAAAVRSLGFDPSEHNRNEIVKKYAMYYADGRKVPLTDFPSSRAWQGKRISAERFKLVNARGEESTIVASAYPVVLDGEPGGLVVLWRDISDRVRAEQTLRQSEERFRQLAESMPQLVWTAREDGSVDYYNRRKDLYRGIDLIDGKDWAWGPVLHPDDHQATVDAWNHALESGEIYQIEHRLSMADGSYRWHLSRGLPARDENGEVTRWYGTATDIHDQKMAEELLRAYNDRLERSNRDLQEFAFVASHDLQEPLRKIEALGDALVQRSDNLNEHQRDYLDRIRKSAGRMRSMVNGLLALSRLNTQARNFEPLDLNAVVAEVVSDFELTIRKTGGQVEIGDLPEVNGDRLQMRLLFQNLIGNALKFQPEGGRPGVKISSQRSADKWVEVRVEDNGIGFDPAHAENLFQPFHRLVSHTQFEGSGIGLAICRRIVERHGGWIDASSEPGIGSRFTVTIPA